MSWPGEVQERCVDRGLQIEIGQCCLERQACFVVPSALAVGRQNLPLLL